MISRRRGVVATGVLNAICYGDVRWQMHVKGQYLQCVSFECDDCLEYGCVGERISQRRLESAEGGDMEPAASAENF